MELSNKHKKLLDCQFKIANYMLLFLREKKCLVLYMITLFSIDEFDQIPVRQNQNKCQKSPQPQGLETFDLLKSVAE